MDIKAIMEQKFILESNILKMIQDFQLKTSASVDNVRVSTDIVRRLSGEQMEVQDVKVDIIV